MRKILQRFFFTLFLITPTSMAQVGLGIFGLAPDDAKEYSRPLATFFGTYLNSGSYYSADLPETFQFKFSIIGMYSFIGDGQKTFTPNSGLEGYSTSGTTGTFVGEKGSYYTGPGGFLAYPGGFNVSNAPGAIYQFAGSLYGTELMLRYFPQINFGDVSTGLWGVGLKHQVSQWFPGMPFDLSLQVLFNNFNLENNSSDETEYIKFDSKNFAINVHGSKTFQEMFVVYGGLQYESSTMDLDYFFQDPNELYPSIRDTRQSTSVDGDNVFRFTGGGAIKVLPVVFNLDFNITTLFTLTGGISLQL